MSIQKINRKSKPFLVRCRDIDGKQISATFATRSEAEAFQNEHAKEKSLPDDIQISGMDRSDFVRIRQLCNDFNITLADVYSITKKSLENSVFLTLIFLRDFSFYKISFHNLMVILLSE